MSALLKTMVFVLAEENCLEEIKGKIQA